MKMLLWLVCFLCMPLVGCTLYQKPKIPAVQIPNHFKHQIKITYAPLNYYWWENFHDAKLNRLISCALTQNYSYQVALKNIDIARTYVTQNQSNLFPQVSLVMNSSRNKSQNLFNVNNFVTSADNSRSNNTGFGNRTFGRIFNLQQLFASVSYEVDIWNQIGNSIHQAQSDVCASAEQSKVVRLTLIANVVNTYFQIKAINSAILNLREQYKVTSELTHTSHAQYRGKVIDATTVLDTRNQLENIKISILNLEKQKEILINTLAYVLGLIPEEFVIAAHDILREINYNQLIPSGIPADMIANRPDVQIAYFQILSYGYIEKQSIANFFPSFVITGNYGYANTSFSKYFTPENTFWNYGATLMQTIFDYKLRMSEYQRANYQFQSSIMNYKDTILNAFQEVDNALVAYKKDHQAMLHYRKETANLNEKIHMSWAQYQSGYGDYATYLNYKLSLLQTKYNLTNQRLLVLQDVIQVYKTLGLGIRQPPNCRIKCDVSLQSKNSKKC